MMHGFWKLTWVETKIFLREPMGVVATLGMPVIVFMILGRSFEAGRPGPAPDAPFNIPILAALLVSVSVVISLVAIISIYREGGILKRLRATPLSPLTILGAHVFIKLVLTVLGLALVVLAGRRMVPGSMEVELGSFTAALLLGTLSVLSMGFLIASVMPSPRFAQSVTAALLYAMIVFSGLFFPLNLLPRPVELVTLTLPTTHAVTLMQGVWDGSGWNLGSAAALVAISLVCATASVRTFRWE